MPQDNDLIDRLNLRVGKPAATVVAVEDTSERHFIVEATLSAVSIFLLSKYLDGFADGLGVKQLGKEHAQLTLLTFDMALQQVSSKIDELKKRLRSLARFLARYRQRTDAKEKGEAAVSQVLSQRGLPDFEATSIASAFTEELFKD